MSKLEPLSWFCERTGLKRGTVASMIARRQVPHVRIGPRLVMFDPDETEAWLAARHVPALERPVDDLAEARAELRRRGGGR